MNPLLLSSAPFLLAASVCAQTVVEVPAMTVPYSVIDMDTMIAGPTSTAALNAAGTNPSIGMSNIAVVPKGVGTGLYMSAPCGSALVAGPGTQGAGMEIIDGFNSWGQYDNMTVEIDFSGPVTEFGLLIGDYYGGTVLDFYSNGLLIASFTSTPNVSCAEKFYQMSGGAFDRVEIDVDSPTGNFVIAQLTLGLPGPSYSVTGMVGGGTATMTVSRVTPGALILIGYSLTGAGPTPTPFGVVSLSNPITRFPYLTANSLGVATMNVNVPPGGTGYTFYTQAADIVSGELTNANTVLIL